MISSAESPTLIDILGEIHNIKDEATAKRLEFLAQQSYSADAEVQVRYSSVPLYEAFDPASFEDQLSNKLYGYPTWLYLFEWLRNIAVLVPVALTWYGLWQAATSYNQQISSNPDLISQPFLLSWERGFPELGERAGWRPNFSELAWLDFFILIGVLTLTFFIDWKRNMSRRQALKDASNERRKLEQVLWHLDLRFAEIRYIHNQSSALADLSNAVAEFPDRARDLVTHLKRERQRMILLMRQETTQYNQLHDFLASLNTSTEQFHEAGKNIEVAFSQFNGSIDSLSTTVENHTAKQSKLILAFDTAGAEARSVKYELRQIGDKFESATASLRDAATAATTTAETALQIVSTALGDLRLATEGLGLGTDILRSSLSDTKAALSGMSLDLSQIIGHSRANAQLLTDAGNALTGARTALDGVTTTNGEIKIALSEVTEKIHSSALQIARATRAMRAIPLQIAQNKIDLCEQTAHLDEAVSRFSTIYANSSQGAQETAIMLGRVASSVTSVAQHQNRILTALGNVTSSMSSVPAELTAALSDLSSRLHEMVSELNRLSTIVPPLIPSRTRPPRSARPRGNGQGTHREQGDGSMQSPQPYSGQSGQAGGPGAGPARSSRQRRSDPPVASQTPLTPPRRGFWSRLRLGKRD